MPAKKELVLLLCVFGGAYFGCLPTAASYVVSLKDGPLYLIYEVPFPGNFVISCIAGGTVGLLCSPVAVVALSRRRRGAVLRLVVGLTSLVVVGLTLVLGLGTATSGGVIPLIALSAVGFCAVCTLVAFLVPKVVTDSTKCRVCGYDLRGSLEVGRCPECGTPFEAVDVLVDQRPERARSEV